MTPAPWPRRGPLLNGQRRTNVTALRPATDQQVLDLALGVHAADGLLVDLCYGMGAMWHGLSYHPLRCDKNLRLPRLDIVGDWCDVARFLGQGRVRTVVADPIHVDHVGTRSVWRRYEPDDLPAGMQPTVMERVAQLLDVGRYVLEPEDGTFILKLADQVHAQARQWQWYRTLQLAEACGLYLCDEYVLPSANMPQTRRLHVEHFASQVRWLVLHTSAGCPGLGLLLEGRTTCAWCGRVVACKRVREPSYCRLPRTCRQAAYRERLRRATPRPS